MATTEGGSNTGPVYDGFISYSHSADDLLAPRLPAGFAAVRQAVVEAAL